MIVLLHEFERKQGRAYGKVWTEKGERRNYVIVLSFLFFQIFLKI